MARKVRPLGPLGFGDGHVVLGDSSSQHVRLTAQGLESRNRWEALACFDWEEVSVPLLRVPITGMRFAGSVLTFAASVITLASMQQTEFSPEDAGSLEVEVDGAKRVLVVSPNRLGKYWEPEVQLVQQFLQHLVENAEARPFLEGPAGVLRRRIVTAAASAGT